MRAILSSGVLVSAALVACPARAYLGSFAPADGYHVQSSTILGDVTLYNAGQYGPNAGGGPGPTQINADSGLWSLAGPVGGYFATAAARNAVVLANPGPPYPPTPSGTVAAYIVGNHSPGRTDNDALALRNDTPSGTGAMIYDYALDTYDFGGPLPSSVTTGSLLTQFYFCPNPGDNVTDPGGSGPGDKFILSFTDSGGNVGLQWGYARDNSVTWRTSSSNPWNTTSFIADQTNWDGLRVNLDLSADTFSMDYFDVSASTWTTLAVAGTAMGQPMTDFTTLRWQLDDGLSAGVGGKNFFDDFSVVVPEPSSALLAMGCGLIFLQRGRRTRPSVDRG